MVYYKKRRENAIYVEPNLQHPNHVPSYGLMGILAIAGGILYGSRTGGVNGLSSSLNLLVSCTSVGLPIIGDVGL